MLKINQMVGTHNSGKFKEIAIFAKIKISVALNKPKPNGKTFLQNSILSKIFLQNQSVYF